MNVVNAMINGRLDKWMLRIYLSAFAFNSWRIFYRAVFMYEYSK